METNKDEEKKDSTEEDTGGDVNSSLDQNSMKTRNSNAMLGSARKSVASATATCSSKITTDPELEGEDGGNAKEPDGLTVMRHKYDRARDDYEELSKDLRDSAMRTMLKMLELQAAQRPQNQANQPHPSSQPKGTSQFKREPNQEAAETSVSVVTAEGTRESVTGADVETQLKALEKRMKLAISRTAESKREQAHLMSLINNLELKMCKAEEAQYIKDIMSKVPEEMDLEKMKRLQLVMMERKNLERDIQRLQMEIKAINNAMANADVIISESAPIKKPRRVVIRTESICQEKQSSQRLILQEFSGGKPEYPTNAEMNNNGSPEPESPESQGGSVASNDEPAEVAKQSEDKAKNGAANNGEVKPESSPTKGKKSKKK